MKLNLSFFFDPFTKMTKDQIIRMQGRIQKGEINSKTGKPFEFPSHVHIIHGGENDHNDFGNYCTLNDIDFGQDRIVKYTGATLVLHNVKIPGEKGELRHLSDAKKTPRTDAPSLSATECSIPYMKTKAQMVTVTDSDIANIDAQQATSVTLSDSTTKQAITGKNLTKLHINECPNYALTVNQLWQIRSTNEGLSTNKLDFKYSAHEEDMTSAKAASNKVLYKTPQP